MGKKGGMVLNTSLIMGIHIDFARGIKKYGSIEQMPQHPVMKRFAKEGHVTVFSIDNEDYSNKLPDNCSHYQIRSKLLFVMLSWLIIGIASRKNNTSYLYYFSASSIFALPFANKLSGAKSILFYGCMLWSSGQDFSQYYKKQMTFKQALFYAFESISLRYADYVIAGSHEIDHMLENSFFRGTKLDINKGVRKMSPMKGIKKNRKRVIFVGWLEDIKNPLALIDAFTRYVNDPFAELVICGDGSMKRECMIHSWFDDRIKLIGQRDDIPEQLQKSGIFVSCSRYEAHSDAMIEAMQMGLPVIASDVGGSRDIVVNDVTGILYQEGNQIALAHSINYLLENPDEIDRMGRNGRRLASRRYDIEKNLDKLVEMMKR